MPNTPLNPDALAQLIMWKELPFGGNPDNYIRLDANAAHKVIELLNDHLAAAHPVVNSVEELDQLPCASVVLNGVTAFQKYGAREPFDWSADGRWYDSTQVDPPPVSCTARR